VVEPPCGETASGRALYFQGNVSGGVSKRRLKMHRTNFVSPNTVCNTPLKEGERSVVLCNNLHFTLPSTIEGKYLY